MSTDPRIDQIHKLITELASGNLDARLEQSNGLDELDAIIEGLNMLAEELAHSVSTGKYFRSLAYHDQLTKLPNRMLFTERLEQATKRARRSKNLIVLLYLDLNGFKPVNDQWGHQVGDLLLQHVAKQMLSVVRECDTVARIGGDEFAIVLEQVTDLDEVRMIAGRISKAIGTPISYQEHELSVQASIGISIFPQDGENLQRLLSTADLAMYHAKNNQQKYVFFSDCETSSKD